MGWLMEMWVWMGACRIGCLILGGNLYSMSRFDLPAFEYFAPLLAFQD